MTDLRLGFLNLTGTIPADPGVWKPLGATLKTLALTGDSSTEVLTGSIPTSLSHLSNLETLNLRGNGGWGACGVPAWVST